MKITEKILAVRREMPDIRKTAKAKAGQFSWAYIDLPTLLETINPLLLKHGLLVSHKQDSVVNNGVIEHRVTCTVTDAETGESVETTAATFIPLSLAGDGNPSVLTWRLQSATTMLRRYTICDLFGIAPDEDDGTVEAVVQSHRPTSNFPSNQSTAKKVPGTILYLKKLAAERSIRPEDLGFQSFDEIDEKTASAIVSRLKNG